MKFLICLLNDMDYADPSFVIKDKEKEAFRDAVERYSDTLNPGGVIEIEKKNEEGKFGRLVYRLNQNDEGGSRFHVTEIFSFDESKGSHLLVWHHAYNGLFPTRVGVIPLLTELSSPFSPFPTHVGVYLSRKQYRLPVHFFPHTWKHPS